MTGCVIRVLRVLFQYVPFDSLGNRHIQMVLCKLVHSTKSNLQFKRVNVINSHAFHG